MRKINFRKMKSKNGERSGGREKYILCPEKITQAFLKSLLRVSRRTWTTGTNHTKGIQESKAPYFIGVRRTNNTDSRTAIHVPEEKLTSRGVTKDISNHFDTANCSKRSSKCFGTEFSRQPVVVHFACFPEDLSPVRSCERVRVLVGIQLQKL
jgi:hypothetical protein